MLSHFPDDLHDLLLSRRIEYKNVSHLQTLSGHLADLIQSFEVYLEKNEKALMSHCGNFTINSGDFYSHLFYCLITEHVHKHTTGYQKYLRNFTELNNEFHQDSDSVVNAICSQLLDNDPGKRKSGRINHVEKLKEKDNVQNEKIERLGRYWKMIGNAYAHGNLKRWFSIDLESFHNVNRPPVLHRESDVLRPDIDREFIEKMQQTVALFKSGMTYCRSSADRYLLKKVASCMGDEKLYVHGALLKRKINGNNAEKTACSIGDADSAVNSGVNSDPGFGADEQSGCFISYAPAERKQKIVSWIQKEMRIRKILVIAPSEERILELGDHFSMALSVKEALVTNCGIVKFGRKTVMGIDTLEIVPDLASEQIITAEANTAGLSFMTYSQLLSILCLDALNAYTVSSGLLTSAMVFGGMPVDTNGSYEPFGQIFSLIKRYRIPFLITLGGHERSCTSFLERTFPHSPVEKSSSISPFVPTMSTQDESYFLAGGALSPDFIRRIIKNSNGGKNQLIICPNPILCPKSIL